MNNEYRNKVLEYFNGDHFKTDLWFSAKNSALGGISPNDMIKIGREEVLNNFIDNCLAGNFS